MSRVQHSDVQHSEAVVRLFSQHQRWLYGYLLALLGNTSDADDVFQEVCVVMWKEHQKFEVGTNFVSWLSVIAYHQAQKLWRNRKREQRFITRQVLDQIAEGMPRDFEQLEAKRRALADCVRKLGEMDRQLVRRCYSEKKLSLKTVAGDLGRPVGTVYKALNRIRRMLFDCVNRELSAEGLA
jgi:RNA polymerase sigma-70 factor (ECF subfamily)